jgi:hypothetical protein
MSISFVKQELENLGNAKRENRQRVAGVIVENPKYFKHIVTLTFATDEEISIRAAWILEWICTHHNLSFMLPHLDEFTAKISLLKFDSAIRPCAKVCEHLAVAYTSQSTNEFKSNLNTKHIEEMVSTCFDWLITPQKIAVRAYSMNTLFLFGLQEKWIHPELKHLISTKIIHQSKGTKARGKQILKLIEKHNK